VLRSCGVMTNAVECMVTSHLVRYVACLAERMSQRGQMNIKEEECPFTVYYASSDMTE
jgi:hypothetical protein